MTRGTVYTETTVYSPPEAYAAEAPYQIAIIELDAGGRITARIRGEAAGIGDRVESEVSPTGVPTFRKAIAE